MFVVALAISAIHPVDWQDFLIEHALTLLILGGLIILTRREPLSNRAWTLVCAYLLLHVVGAHYTYSKVPYDQWSQCLIGRAFPTRFTGSGITLIDWCIFSGVCCCWFRYENW